MNVLLTGISGFIGNHVAKALLENGHTIWAPVRKESAPKIDNLKTYNTLHVLDGPFYEPDTLKQIGQPVDIIIHLASIRGAGMGTLGDYTKVNVAGTQTLLDFAVESNIPKFIYCSTVGVLGSIPKNVPARPEDKPRADGLYHQTKYESEKRVLATNNGLVKTCVVRPTITYGTGDDGFIPKMIQMVSRRQFVLSTKKVKLHLLDVSSFADLIGNMMDNDNWAGQIFHVADKQPVVLGELVNTISKLQLKQDYPRIYKAPGFIYRMVSVLLTIFGMQKINTSIKLISRDWYYDISKTVTLLGYKPSETLTSLKSVLNGKQSA